MTTAQVQLQQLGQQALAAGENQLVLAVSKPGAIDALRKTWRSSSEHLWAQVNRFLRIFVVTLIPQVVSLLVTNHSLSRNALEVFVVSVVVPTGEVVWRQVHPALTAGEVDAAPGATIVPEQVGLPGAPATVITQPVPEPDPVADPAVDAPAEPVDAASVSEQPVADASADPAPAKAKSTKAKAADAAVPAAADAPTGVPAPLDLASVPQDLS